MEHIKKLYGKAYHLYTIEDWKYIFTIYKEKDKYNHTEEEFLAAELIDKTAMMKKMDEKLYNTYIINIDELRKPLVESCSENSCETINAFLDDEDVKDSKDIQLIDEAIKEFLNKETDELEIIKNQFDIAFKDKSRMTIIRDYANQQLIDAQKDLDAVNTTIENLNLAYLNLKTT